MQILLINSEYPPVGGGAGNASENIAQCLVALGHQVTVVTARFKGLPKVESRAGVTVHRVRALRRRQDRSVPLEQLAFLLSATVWSVFHAWRSRPDVTLAFFGIPSGAVAWLVKRLSGVPYIVSLRGGDVPGFRPYDFRRLHARLRPYLRVIWRDAAAVIANSRGLRQLALNFYPSIEAPVIPNGVDVELFAQGNRVWSPPRLLSVGRIVHQKGLDLAVRALADLKDLEWEWSIAGDGPKLETLKSMARELGISDRISFLGWQSHEALLKYYRRSNLLLHPSRHEGMPNAVLEAMASGLPVVATRISGNEDLVAHGETGLLVHSEDVDDLRRALRELLNDAARRKAMGDAARLRVERDYTWQTTAEKYQVALQLAMHQTT